MSFTTSNDINTIARRLSALEASVRTLRASVPRSIAGLSFPADSKEVFWTGSSDGGTVAADFDSSKDCSLSVGDGLWLLVGFAEVVGATTETGVNVGLAGDAERPGEAGQCVALSNGSGAVAAAIVVTGPGECRAIRYIKGNGSGTVNEVRLFAIPVKTQNNN